MAFSQEERERNHIKISDMIRNLFHIEDLSGVEILSSLNRIVQIVEMIDSRPSEDGQAISGPRWRVLLHLFISTQLGKSNGLTPTELSHYQQVSKNTVSSLLRGLEEQGYIERELDPQDLRTFRIHLSETGRQLIIDTAPTRIESLNKMMTGLSPEETTQLTLLLKKLHCSLENQLSQFQKVSAG
jgi:DNA-binding MarR family transcriptional regulator